MTDEDDSEKNALLWRRFAFHDRGLGAVKFYLCTSYISPTVSQHGWPDVRVGAYPFYRLGIC